MNLPILDVDPYSPALLLAPYDYYRQVRELGPVVRIDRYDVCAVARIDLVEQVFRDWKTFRSSRGVGLADFKKESPWRPPSIILEVDPPAHERTRTVMARAMSPKAVKSMQDRFAIEAEACVSRAVECGEVDGVADLAEAYPLKVFADAVGLEDGDRSNLLHYGRMVFDALGPDNQIRRDSMACAELVVPWITARCRREVLKAGGFGQTIYAACDTGDITEEEASLLVRSLLSAGIDTTVATIGNMLYSIANHPHAWETLKADHSRASAAIEEVLRFESPIHTFCRTIANDTRLDDVELAEGTKIMCVIAAANRDPRRWDRPDTFDITRSSRPHVAFGSGIHVCVGQHVARQEAFALLSALLCHVDSIEPAGAPEWRPANAVHAPARLPLVIRAL